MQAGPKMEGAKVDPRLRIPVLIAVLTWALALAGCAAWLPGGSVTRAATVVYTTGARQYTATVELDVLPANVFETLVDIVEERPNTTVINQNDNAHLIEVSLDDGRRFTGQVTRLGSGSSLLYIWADAGRSGLSGEEMAIAAIEFICERLGVEYELVNY